MRFKLRGVVLMGSKGWTGRTSMGALVGIAVVQVGALLAFDGDTTATPSVEEGFSFAQVQVRGSDGETASLATGDEPLLVLVFHSTCTHCERVAPEWSQWLSEAPAGLRVIAVSRESHEVAAAYAARHQWPVQVGSVVGASLGSAGFQLSRRTPWVFGLDGRGRVIAHGHGSELARVAEELTDG